MNCATVQKSLSAYLDRQLPHWEKERTSTHIESCSSCQTELQTLLNVKQQLRSISLPSLPAEVRAKIEAETILKVRQWPDWTSMRWWVPTFAFAAGAAAWFLLHHQKSPRSPELPLAKTHQEKVIAMHHTSRNPSDTPQ